MTQPQGEKVQPSLHQTLVRCRHSSQTLHSPLSPPPPPAILCLCHPCHSCRLCKLYCLRPSSLQVMELTQGQRVEVEILGVLVQQMQNSRQEHGMQGSDTPPGTPPKLMYALLHALPPRKASFAASSLSAPAGVSKQWQHQYSAGMENEKSVRSHGKWTGSRQTVDEE